MTGCSRARIPRGAEGRQGVRGPGRHRGDHVHGDREQPVPAGQHRGRADRLLPLQVRPDEPERGEADPGDDRRGAEVVRDAGRLRPARPASRSSASPSPARATGSSSGSRRTCTSAAGSGRHRRCSRSCSTGTSSPGRRSTTPTRASSNGISGGGQITNIGKYGEAKDSAIVLQTGALPYVFNQLEQSQVSATLGQGLAERGEARRRDRPARRRALPAARLPLPRRRRGDRPRHLRGVPLRRDPAPQRDPDPAGLRRDRS